MIATLDSAQATLQSAIIVDQSGIIQAIDDSRSDINESAEDLSTSQEFPSWPCQTGKDYKLSFIGFVNKANLPLNNLDLQKMKRKIKDKINALQNSPFSNLLSGPCLPIICPNIEACYYQEVVDFYWQKIGGNFRHKVDLLPASLKMRDQSDFAFPLRLESYTVRLVFPQALPPLSSAGMFSFGRDLKQQHYLSFAGPLEMLVALLTFPGIFKGNFRVFFPDFYVGTGEEYEQIPFLASNRHTLTFQTLGGISPKIFDFCPVMF